VLGAAASDWELLLFWTFTVAFVVFSEEEERGPTVRHLRIIERFSEEERVPTVGHLRIIERSSALIFLMRQIFLRYKRI
jgi:hypothetical protein